MSGGPLIVLFVLAVFSFDKAAHRQLIQPLSVSAFYSENYHYRSPPAIEISLFQTLFRDIEFL